MLSITAWRLGRNGTVEQQPFLRVVELDQSGTHTEKGPNYFQCMAIAYWATGDKESAVLNLEEAQRSVAAIMPVEFSCWRYCRIKADTFLADLMEIRALIMAIRRECPCLFLAPKKSTWQKSEESSHEPKNRPQRLMYAN